MIPPNIDYDLDATLRDFWKLRAEHHTRDTYRGRDLCKMPEDLRTYQHLIEDSKPEVILELGSWQGGSAVWFADQLDAFGLSGGGRPSVVTLDMRKMNVDLVDPRIVVVTGRVDDEAMVERIRPHLVGRRVFISEDSGHNLASTSAALKFYSPFVTPGSWFVIEDGIVDEPEVKLPRYSGGVQPAIEQFLSTDAGSRFSRHWLHPYGLTTDFGGWLKAER